MTCMLSALHVGSSFNPLKTLHDQYYYYTLFVFENTETLEANLPNITRRVVQSEFWSWQVSFQACVLSHMPTRAWLGGQGNSVAQHPLVSM